MSDALRYDQTEIGNEPKRLTLVEFARLRIDHQPGWARADDIMLQLGHSVAISELKFRNQIRDAAVEWVLGVRFKAHQLPQVAKILAVIRDLVRPPRHFAVSATRGLLLAAVLLFLCPMMLFQCGAPSFISFQSERGKLLVQFGRCAGPRRAMAIDGSAQARSRSSSNRRWKIGSTELDQQNMDFVQVAVSQLYRGTFIPVEIEPRSRIFGRLARKIVRRGARSDDTLHQRVQPHDLEVAQLMPVRDYVMAAPGWTVEEIG